MNQRIFELAELALEETHRVMGSTSLQEAFDDFYTEKFAELIVRQMLDVTDAHTEVFRTDRDKALIEHIKQSVKQHFGVEE